MFYREAEAHMRIDVYAASLVMWELMSRTQLDQRDQVCRIIVTLIMFYISTLYFTLKL